MTPDATVGADAGGKKHDGGGGTKHDGSPQDDAPAPPDGSTHAEAGDSGSAGDAGDAGSPGDAGEDATTGDAGHDAGAHDAGVDAMSAPDAGSGVDASSPPGGCFYDYSCGSAKCGCNQLCDDGTTCGACLPHFGTCGLDAHDCDTDFSSTFSCGGCGNICTCLNPFNVSCSKNASGDYVCGC